jgi:hypothetical protein
MPGEDFFPAGSAGFGGVCRKVGFPLPMYQI